MKETQYELILTHSPGKNSPSQIALFSILSFKSVQWLNDFKSYSVQLCDTEKKTIIRNPNAFTRNVEYFT